MHDSELTGLLISPGTPASPSEANPADGFGAVKHRHSIKPLTLGGCVAGVCEACGPDQAEGFLRFAVNSGIIVFPGRRQVEVAPRDSRTDGLPNPHQVTGLIRYFLSDETERRPAEPSSRRTPLRSVGRRAVKSIQGSTANGSTGQVCRRSTES